MSLGLVMLLAVVGTTIWVGVDASKRDWQGGTGTGGWVVGCILLWIVVFPWYLAKRGKVPLKGEAAATAVVSGPEMDGLPRPRLYRECPHCKEAMRRDAEVCPHCRRETTPWELINGVWWHHGEQGWHWLNESEGEWIAHEGDVPGQPTEVGEVRQPPGEPVSAASVPSEPAEETGEAPMFVMSEPAMAPMRRRPWKLIALVTALALVAIVVATAVLAGGGSHQAVAPLPAKPTVKKRAPARPTRYAQLLPRGVTVKRAAAPACAQYQALVNRWQETAQSRGDAVNGVGSDPYAAADFVGQAGNGWVNATTEPGFERQVKAISRKRLVAATGQRSGLITPTMVERFNGDALFVCHVGAYVRDTETKLADLDRNASTLTGLAASKPWYPKGYNADPSDDNVAFQWDNNIGKCQANDLGYCWGMRVIARDGCPNSLYAEINILSGGTVVDYSNDTTGSLEPGQVAELAFQSFEQGYGQLQGQLKAINCY